MALNPHPIYPSAGRYVLRLHRDARPQGGVLVGRIEHVTSGESCVFASSEELPEWLERRAVDHLHPKENKSSDEEARFSTQRHYQNLPALAPIGIKNGEPEKENTEHEC